MDHRELLEPQVRLDRLVQQALLDQLGPLVHKDHLEL